MIAIMFGLSSIVYRVSIVFETFCLDNGKQTKKNDIMRMGIALKLHTSFNTINVFRKCALMFIRSFIDIVISATRKSTIFRGFSLPNIVCLWCGFDTHEINMSTLEGNFHVRYIRLNFQKVLKTHCLLD